MDAAQVTLNLLSQLVFQSKLAFLHDLAKASSNPLTASPGSPPIKIFSQNDEDGILARIFQRIGCNGPGSFLELGVDANLECNSLALLYAGWKGTWVDAVNHNLNKQNPKLQIIEEWVTVETLSSIISRTVSFNEGSTELDFLSIDLDGNDLYVLRAILKKLTAKVICLEYNPHYIPPARFSIDYDPVHNVEGDFYGASLQLFVDELKGRYRLVATNLTGVNAFFVDIKYSQNFQDITDNVLSLYTPPRYYSTAFDRLHPISQKSIKKALG